jgi:hypothetical protein
VSQLAGEVDFMSDSNANLEPDWRRRLYDARRHCRDEVRARFSRPHRCPVFILGMQKSGTSAIAGLLGLRTGLPTTIDLERDWRETTVDTAGVDADAFDRFVRRNAVDFSRAIVKEPNLTFLVDRIRDRWPEAPLVFVVRDPAETIRSILDRLDLPGDLNEFPADRLAATPLAWRVVLDNRWIGVETAHPIESLAARWRRAAEIALAAGEDTLLVRYEDFKSNLAVEIDRIALHLGLEVTADITEALDRPFQPPGRPRAVADVFGPNLERIRRVVAPVAASLGYDA